MAEATFRISMLGVMISMVMSESLFPPQLPNNLAYLAKATTNSACSGCPGQCQYRSGFPNHNTISVSDRTTCPDILSSDKNTLPAHVSKDGFSLNQNCSISKSFLAGADNQFAVSFWIKNNCNSGPCNILSIGTYQISINNSHIQIDSTPYGSLNSNWKHIILMKSSSVKTIDSSSEYVWLGIPLASSTINVNFDTTTNIAALVADVRLYSGHLTEREILNLTTGIDPVSVEYPECRCPASNLYESSDVYGLYCFEIKNDTNSGRKLRLNAASLLPVFALDQDPSTSWRSGISSAVTFTVELQQTFMIDSVTVDFVNSAPLRVSVSFENRNNFTLSSVGSGSWEWEESTNVITDRLNLQNRLASVVTIYLSGHSSVNYYQISEIKINGRYNCFGNANSVNFTSCSCESSTRTAGFDCGQCKSEYYREVSDFACTKPCSCSKEGSRITNDCQDEGGQCACKILVTGRTCDVCEPFAYNYSPSGCTACSNCDNTGSWNCSDNGTCNCKPNVIGSNCDACETNHYGFSSRNGCLPCNCNNNGTMQQEKSCNLLSGKCDCKENVQGRECNECKDKYHNLNLQNSVGCSPCDCNNYGSSSPVCGKDDGICSCMDGRRYADNRQCDAVFDSNDLNPTYGPQAGGTLITVSGNLFGRSTNNIQLFANLNSNKFTLKSLKSTEMIIETLSVSQTGEDTLTIQWVKAYNKSSDVDFRKDFKFTFKENPSVVGAFSLASYKSIPCKMTITGQNLNNVHRPFIQIKDENKILSTGQACTSEQSGRKLKCPVPEMPDSLPDNSTYELVLDGMASSLSNLSAKVTYMENLETRLENLEFQFKFWFSQELKLSGKRLMVCEEDNYQVFVGNYHCEIKTHTDELITCKINQEINDATHYDLNVTLKIGSYRMVIGTVDVLSFWNTLEIQLIIAAVCAFILAIVVIVILCVCRKRLKCKPCRRKKSADSYSGLTKNGTKSRENSYAETSIGVDNVAVEIVQNAPITAQVNPILQPSEKKIELLKKETNQEQFTSSFIKRLEKAVKDDVKKCITKKDYFSLSNICTYKGSCIRILKGEFVDGPCNGQKATIKTIIDNFSSFGPEEKLLPSWVSVGLAQCMKLNCYSNNTVGEESLCRCMGISADAQRFYVLYPEMSRFLKGHLQDPKQELTLKNLLDMCLHIAKGMQYLTSCSVVHKDLAARNCIVSMDGVVKVSDGSFAWDLFPEEYIYDSERERHLPVRWLAEDCLSYGFYDQSTDVWSFGILMWEIMSRGMYLPYPDVDNNDDIKDHVMSGYRPGKPDITPDNLYDLMMTCWESKSDNRPTFQMLMNQLTNMVAHDGMDDDDDQELYENWNARTSL